jgi:tetratricopeptide (TPR) repeat protein
VFPRLPATELAGSDVSRYDMSAAKGRKMPEICWSCGQPVPPGKRVCECGAEAGRDWFGARETILLITFLALVGAFAVTALAARFYHDRRRDLAEFWFGQGTSDLRAGNASAALSDLQTALIYARQDVSDARQQAFSLDLEQALAADHRLDEAHSYLLDLWQSTPDSARVNLELAHLAVAQGNDAEAQRYYGNAIYGLWQGSPDQVRQYQRDTQLEFCRYLLDQNEKTAAQSVLLAVAASLPRNPQLHIQVGTLMLEAAATDQALGQYQQALEIDPHNRDALIGAGLSSFDLGKDPEAVRYLGQASEQKLPAGPSAALPPDAARDLSIASADLSEDFFGLAIGPNERAHRATRAYEVARARLEACAESIGVSLSAPAAARISPSRSAANDSSSAGGASSVSPAPDDISAAYQQALKMQNSSREAVLERDPQFIGPLGKFVLEAESAASAHCGAPTTAEDAALIRLERQYTPENHE